jgi:hypothetical protein
MRRLAGIMGIVACACGPAVDLDPGTEGDTLETTASVATDTHSTTTSPSEATGPTSATTGSATADPSTTTDPDTTGDPSTTTSPTCGALDDGDGDGGMFDIGPLHLCDLFLQDCEAGMKCVPQGFLQLGCVPIDPAPLPDGTPCPVDVSDPCGPLSWCTPAGPSGEGTCVPLCTGSYFDPVCPDDTLCVVDDEIIVAYCALPCDPFAVDACAFGSCLPTLHGFGCVPGGEATAGEHCFQHDSCVDQHACRDAAAVPGCCDAKCCAPLCDDDHPCAGGSCIPLEPPVPGPPGIGTCAEG